MLSRKSQKGCGQSKAVQEGVQHERQCQCERNPLVPGRAFSKKSSYLRRAVLEKVLENSGLQKNKLARQRREGDAVHVQSPE